MNGEVMLSFFFHAKERERGREGETETNRQKER